LKTYADTSFLYSLYVQQAHSANAAAYMAAAGDTPLPLTMLGRFELFNAIRLSLFRKQLDSLEAAADLKAIQADIRGSVLLLVACDWAAVHSEAERLSAKHTGKRGHRSMDVLHVASALCLGAKDFLTFDQNQAKLGTAAGLTIKP
jgi:predicted nucleic acid-binding protein